MNNPLVLRLLWSLAGQLRRQESPAPVIFQDVTVAQNFTNAPAVASISADFELCWAWRSLPVADCERLGRMERSNVPLILKILEEAQVPITWATVGHMFLDRCHRGAGGCPHPDMPRPQKNILWDGDWYRHDPCSNVSDSPGWYAPDLIRMIQESPVRHELGTHSFSHIDFSSDTSTPELVRAELLASVEAMRPFGVKPTSLVFCFNHMGHHYQDLLAELGITAVRHRDDRFRLAEPERSSAGVYRIFETMNLRRARRYDYVAKARIFIDSAIQRRTSYHLWFHPSDNPSTFRDIFAPIVQYIGAKGRENLLWVATMSEVAAYREARSKLFIRVEKKGSNWRLNLESTLDRDRFGDPEVTLLVSCDEAPRLMMVVDVKGGRAPAPLAFQFCEHLREAKFNLRTSSAQVEIRWK